MIIIQIIKLITITIIISMCIINATIMIVIVIIELNITVKSVVHQAERGVRPDQAADHLGVQGAGAGKAVHTGP